MQFEVEVPSSRRGPCIIRLAGDIDIYSSPDAKAALDGVIDREHFQVLVNLKAVRYIDSTGIGVLVGALKRVGPHGGSINLVSMNPTVRRIFEITDLLDVFGVYDDEQLAIKALA